MQVQSARDAEMQRDDNEHMRAVRRTISARRVDVTHHTLHDDDVADGGFEFECMSMHSALMHYKFTYE